MTRIHITITDDPLQAGGSLVALCGKPITKSYIVAFLDSFFGRADLSTVGPKCKDCWEKIWHGRFISAVAEADEVPDLVKESSCV